ncbi:hypothetical protein CDIK_1047 [Cucumispora dikerogammari]|nr:hypothetical protein CDIK_1047 [Cucumispora dikerogammari]
MHLLITNPSGGLCFASSSISDLSLKSDFLITASLISSLQTISKQIKTHPLQKTTLIFDSSANTVTRNKAPTKLLQAEKTTTVTLNNKNIKIIIFSSIRNNFIFITNNQKKDVSEKVFKEIYHLYITEVLRDYGFQEEAFVKSEKFVSLVDAVLNKI